MKMQCNGCGAAEAQVMCCADEAALCWACDERVHAANKLAGKHQRVPLIAAPSPSRLPKCDICQVQTQSNFGVVAGEGREHISGLGLCSRK